MPLGRPVSLRGRGIPRIPPLEGMRAPFKPGAGFTVVENEALSPESQPMKQLT